MQAVNETYNDKVVRVSGVVREVGTESTGPVNVLLETGVVIEPLPLWEEEWVPIYWPLISWQSPQSSRQIHRESCVHRPSTLSEFFAWP